MSTSRFVILVTLVTLLALNMPVDVAAGKGQIVGSLAGDETVRTLILVNYRGFEVLYGPGQAGALMDKLYELAAHEWVLGLVVQVEADAAVSAAHKAWLADLDSQMDTDKANAVARAIRDLVLTYLDAHANVTYIVIVGDDRLIPHRRVPDRGCGEQEQDYALEVTPDTTIAAALQGNMVLTDDYYADRVPTHHNGQELYIPDYAIGRLVERPREIIPFIDAFLANHRLHIQRALVTGYDFFSDSSRIIRDYLQRDGIRADGTLIGNNWTGADMRDRQLEGDVRYDVQFINGHMSHTAAKGPDGDPVSAAEVAGARSDMAGALVFSAGCHAGLNDPGLLDLLQAYARKRAHFVGNTGYGFGGAGIGYSEGLTLRFVRELLRDTASRIGVALMVAKQKHYAQSPAFNANEAKALMELTLYGLPMVQVSSGATFNSDAGFHPSSAVAFALRAYWARIRHMVVNSDA